MLVRSGSPLRRDRIEPQPGRVDGALAAAAAQQRLQARMSLRAQKGDEAFQEWLRQLRDKAFVEYRLEEK